MTFAIFSYSYINLLLLIGITLFLQVSLWLLQFSGLNSVNNLKNISICSLWLIGLSIMASIWRWWQSCDITYSLKSWGERLGNRFIIKTNVFLLKSEIQSITQYPQKLSLFILAVPVSDIAGCCRTTNTHLWNWCGFSLWLVFKKMGAVHTSCSPNWVCLNPLFTEYTDIIFFSSLYLMSIQVCLCACGWAICSQ